MYCLRQLTALPCKLHISWHRVIGSSRRLLNSKAFGTFDETTPSTSEDSNDTVDDDLPELVVDAVNKERPILPYSQKALETLKLDKFPYYVEREWWKHGHRMTFWATWRMKRDVKRRHLLAELGPDRVRLKALKSNIVLPELIREECSKKLHNFPKASCPSLVQHLCQFSGARRGKLNRFHLHRQIFRPVDMAFVGALLTLLYPLIQGSLCAEMYFLSAEPVKLPDPSTVLLSDVVQANKYMMGMSAKAPSQWSSEGDVLERPRALVVVTVTDGKALNLSISGYALSREATNSDHSELIDSKMYGDEEQEWLIMRDAQLTGSKIASDAQDTPVKIEIKTKAEPLRQEIENLYKIAESVRKSEFVGAATTPTILILDVRGMPVAEEHLSVGEYKQAVSELQKAILYLTLTLKNKYSDRIIVELIAESNTEIKTRRKREAGSNDPTSLSDIRRRLNVYQFVSSSYPAMFGIIAGVSIALALAVLFVAVGLWNMDPGKDSIIYRMTTTRMKKD